MSRPARIWQRAYWTEVARRRAYRREHPPYNSRRARAARAEAALRRAQQAPRMVPSQVTSLWTDGRVRVTDYNTRTGRKTRVHETRPRAKDRDGMRPRQRRTAR